MLFRSTARTGNVYLGKIATQEAELTGDFGRFMGWADEIRTLNVRTNGDTPRDATQARKFGAEGIGLCRTEHMFFEPDRIKAVREMIVSDTVEQRKAALWPRSCRCSAATLREFTVRWAACR